MRAAICWLVCAGCLPRPVAAPPPQVVVVPAPAPVGPRDPVAGLLDAAGVVVGMPRERQEQELERWTTSLARTDQPTDRLRLALLLTLGDPAVQDPERVRTLLRNRTWGANEAAYETLSRLLLELVETRTDGASERIELALALAAERERRQQLEQQLEALKAIETEIDARDGKEDGDAAYPGG